MNRTSGTSCHLTFGKCPINQNNLLEHWKLFYFETALTSTSEDDIKTRAIAQHQPLLSFFLNPALDHWGKGCCSLCQHSLGSDRNYS